MEERKKITATGLYQKEALIRNLIRIFCLVLVIGVYGCSAINLSRYPDGTDFFADERLNNPESLPEVGLSIINTGELYQAERFLNSSGSLLKKATALVPCVLVRHPRGTILYDSGLGGNVERDFKEAMPFAGNILFPYRFINSAREQMRMSGTVDPDSVRTIIMSHLHFDHASGMEDFPEAEIWTTREDYYYAQDKTGMGFSRSMFENDKIKWRFLNFHNKPYENFDQSLDLFGDGSVVLVPLPGHTPCLTGMFVNLPSGRRFFFINDAVLFSEDVRIPAKPWPEKYLVDYDSRQNDAAVAGIHRLMKQYPDLVIISSHENAGKYADRLFPNFIK